MALHILLADDSLPAQNMGKKILVDAGYDVTTVSNGLEALRKIADTVPDIAILDIFMPGYTGLEVCQKLRNSLATSTLPVILTVGKLEPYRAEDGERVRSNAVIVKPFAAAELISAVRSLVGGPPPAAPEHSPAHDPLEHAPFTGGFAAPLESSTPAGAPLQDEAAPDELADEPLFTYGSTLATETEPLRSNMDGGYGAEPLLSGEDAGGPQSLMFNPDAAHTPFSASATDLLPSLAAEKNDEESPFSEFDLQSSESVYSGAVDLSGAVEQHESADILSPDGDSIQEMTEPLTTSESGANVDASPPLASVPAEAAPANVALDPLLDISQPEVPPSILDRSVLEVGEPPELLTSDFPAPATATEQEEPLGPEEEARRKAFEDLFNSPDLPPLEESPAIASEMHSDILPSISTKHATETSDIQPDPELEPLGETFSSVYAEPSSTLSTGAELNLLEEEDERRAIGSIPDRDVLFEHSQESASQVTDAPAEDLLTFDGEQFPSQDVTPLEIEKKAASVEFVPQVQGILTHASAPEPNVAPLEEDVTPTASQTAPPEEQTPHVEPEPATEAASAAVEHLPAAEPEPVPEAVAPEQAVPEHSALATPEAKPEAVAPEHAAPEDIPAAESEHTSSHSVLPSFAELATGAGIAAAFPTLSHLAHLVESEARHAFASPEPAHIEPEAHMVEPSAVAASPAASIDSIPVPKAEEELPEPIAAAPESIAAEPAHALEVETLAATPEVVHSEPLVSEPELHPVAATEPEKASIDEPPAPEAKQHPDEPEIASVAAAHSSDTTTRSAEAERVHQAVERVFDRFKPLLVAAIVRELARHD